MLLTTTSRPGWWILDGTLVDTLGDFVAALGQVAEQLGAHAADPRLGALRHRSRRRAPAARRVAALESARYRLRAGACPVPGRLCGRQRPPRQRLRRFGPRIGGAVQLAAGLRDEQAAGARRGPAGAPAVAGTPSGWWSGSGRACDPSRIPTPCWKRPGNWVCAGPLRGAGRLAQRRRSRPSRRLRQRAAVPPWLQPRRTGRRRAGPGPPRRLAGAAALAQRFFSCRATGP
jgi:hypothetical protein